MAKCCAYPVVVYFIVQQLIFEHFSKKVSFLPQLKLKMDVVLKAGTHNNKYAFREQKFYRAARLFGM
jgi:hypothetical protein